MKDINAPENDKQETSGKFDETLKRLDVIINLMLRSKESESIERLIRENEE